jgi:AraC family transcriptional regulator of adaptative response / DNA-3-methyladenine glycosylase II
MVAMNTDASLCYQAVLARDARYDGRFFTCVKTTGVYCRPICPARAPLLKHCEFVPSAAAAQEAGYRPCLRCRPESSPGMGAWCGTSTSVQRALTLIDMGALDDGDVGGLAERLGLGDRHLRRLFKEHLGTTPIAVAQTRRVLLAKQLIHQTQLSMTSVALASGFGSVRRFNETFVRVFGRAPASLRRHDKAEASANGAVVPQSDIELRLAYRPPYDWPRMLAFLKGRAIPGVEFVDETAYRRIIDVGGDTSLGHDDGDQDNLSNQGDRRALSSLGLLEVSHLPSQHSLLVKVQCPRLDRLPGVIARVRRMFDLDADPVAIEASLSRDPKLAALVAPQSGLRLPGAWDAFEASIRAILGQQITVSGATRLAGQLVATLGRPAPHWPEHPQLTHAFPSAASFTAEGLAALGMPSARRAALLGLAQEVAAQPNLLAPRQSLEASIERLCALPGIGDWTAQYIAMRALHESDAFPAGDVGIQRAMAVDGVRPTIKALLAHSEQWRPWRAYAVLHLWTSETPHHDDASTALTATAA